MDSQTSQKAPPTSLPCGKACTRPPGPAAAAGLNKYVAEGTCWQLGPRYGRRCLCCGFARAQRRRSCIGTPRFLGVREKEGSGRVGVGGIVGWAARWFGEADGAAGINSPQVSTGRVLNHFGNTSKLNKPAPV